MNFLCIIWIICYVGSGKTTIVKRIIDDAHRMYIPAIVTIIYAYGQWTDMIPQLINEGIAVCSGAPTDEYLAGLKRPVLLILGECKCQ